MGEFVGVVEVFLAAGGGLGHVDRREKPLLGEVAVEADFHVAGALEFLEDDVIHAAFGFDEAGGDDGEAAALFEVAGGAEELAALEGGRAEAAGADRAAALGVVVSPGEAGEAVEEDDDILADFDQARARSRTRSETWAWRLEGSSKVELKTSASTAPRSR